LEILDVLVNFGLYFFFVFDQDLQIFNETIIVIILLCFLVLKVGGCLLLAVHFGYEVFQRNIFAFEFVHDGALLFNGGHRFLRKRFPIGLEFFELFLILD